MYSQLGAILRGLVLPFGAVTGARIVLDGVNGVISVYNSANTEAARIDSTGVLVQGTNGASVKMNSDGLSGYITLSAPTGLANPTLPATLETYLKPPLGVATPAVALISPSDSTIAGGVSSVELAGGTAASPLGVATLSGDAVVLSGDVKLLVSVTPVVNSTLTLASGHRAMAGSNSTEEQVWASGSTVLTTNASGDATINTGLTTIRGYSVVNGDGTARANITMGRSAGGIGASSITMRVWNGATGAVVAGINVRFDWVAFGVL